MKIYNYAIALVAAITLSGVAGCNKKNNTEPQEPSTKSMPLKINVGVGKINSATSNTKSSGVVTGATFSDEQKINVILVAEKAEEEPIKGYPVATNYKYDLATTKWTPENVGNIPLTVTAYETRVLAHYPSELPSGSTLSPDMKTLTPMIYDEKSFGEYFQLNFNLVKIPVAALDNLEVFFDKTEDDYMTGNGGKVTAIAQPTKSTIIMHHALAMIVVKIGMLADNPEAGSTISGFNIENAPNKSAMKRGSFNLADNVFNPNGTAINYKRPMVGFPVNNCFGILTYPATIAVDDVVIKCFVGAATYTYKVPAVKWESGFVYLYDLTLSAAGVVLDSEIKVVDWPTTPTDIVVPVE